MSTTQQAQKYYLQGHSQPINLLYAASNIAIISGRVRTFEDEAVMHHVISQNRGARVQAYKYIGNNNYKKI